MSGERGDEFRWLVNERKKILPNIYRDPEYYTENDLCIICGFRAGEDANPFPLDPKREKKIHRGCLAFVRSHWICRGCGKYFPHSQEPRNIPGRGLRCEACHRAALKSLKEGGGRGA
jgi:hypothetical protein